MLRIILILRIWLRMVNWRKGHWISIFNVHVRRKIICIFLILLLLVLRNILLWIIALMIILLLDLWNILLWIIVLLIIIILSLWHLGLIIHSYSLIIILISHLLIRNLRKILVIIHIWIHITCPLKVYRLLLWNIWILLLPIWILFSWLELGLHLRIIVLSLIMIVSELLFEEVWFEIRSYWLAYSISIEIPITVVRQGALVISVYHRIVGHLWSIPWVVHISHYNLFYYY